MRDGEINPYSVRIRVSHTCTQKSGWRHESSVDLTGNANDTVDVLMQLESWMVEVDNRARAESRRRNKIDGFDEAA